MSARKFIVSFLLFNCSVFSFAMGNNDIEPLFLQELPIPGKTIVDSKKKYVFSSIPINDYGKSNPKQDFFLEKRNLSDGRLVSKIDLRKNGDRFRFDWGNFYTLNDGEYLLFKTNSGVALFPSQKTLEFKSFIFLDTDGQLLETLCDGKIFYTENWQTKNHSFYRVENGAIQLIASRKFVPYGERPRLVAYDNCSKISWLALRDYPSEETNSLNFFDLHSKEEWQRELPKFNKYSHIGITAGALNDVFISYYDPTGRYEGGGSHFVERISGDSGITIENRMMFKSIDGCARPLKASSDGQLLAYSGENYQCGSQFETRDDVHVLDSNTLETIDRFPRPGSSEGKYCKKINTFDRKTKLLVNFWSSFYSDCGPQGNEIEIIDPINHRKSVIKHSVDIKDITIDSGFIKVIQRHSDNERVLLYSLEDLEWS